MPDVGADPKLWAEAPDEAAELCPMLVGTSGSSVAEAGDDTQLLEMSDPMPQKHRERWGAPGMRGRREGSPGQEGGAPRAGGRGGRGRGMKRGPGQEEGGPRIGVCVPRPPGWGEKQLARVGLLCSVRRVICLVRR